MMPATDLWPASHLALASHIHKPNAVGRNAVDIFRAGNEQRPQVIQPQNASGRALRIKQQVPEKQSILQDNLARRFR